MVTDSDPYALTLHKELENHYPRPKARVISDEEHLPKESSSMESWLCFELYQGSYTTIF